MRSGGQTRHSPCKGFGNARRGVATGTAATSCSPGKAAWCPFLASRRPLTLSPRTSQGKGRSAPIYRLPRCSCTDHQPEPERPDSRANCLHSLPSEPRASPSVKRASPYLPLAARKGLLWQRPRPLFSPPRDLALFTFPLPDLGFHSCQVGTKPVSGSHCSQVR